MSTDHAEENVHIDRFTVFMKNRSDRRGGGVAVFVSDDIPSRELVELHVPGELECVWVWMRPYKLPRSVSALAVCGVYIPPNSPHQDTLIEHLLNSTDYLRTKYPDIGIVILGDLNRTDTAPLRRGNVLQQVVEGPTRGDATLDVIITNIQSRYNTPVIGAPLGLSDHYSVTWAPKVTKAANKTHTRVVRPLKDSDIRAFGAWISQHDWNEVYNATSAQEKTDGFYKTLNQQTDKFFPTKVVKIHPTDKPWITTRVKRLIKKRQEAFYQRKEEVWKRLRNKIIRHIKLAKETHYVNKVQQLKTEDPAKWYKELKSVCNVVKPPSAIHVPNVAPDDHKAVADAINKHLSSISQQSPEVCTSDLPAYLPAPSPPPQIMPWEMYRELSRVRVRKAGGPDGIAPRLIRMFACELAEPLTDIFNTSLIAGTVPAQWKEAVVTPIPKELPAVIDKLRPISLTAIFAKICEGIVGKWVLSDIWNNIDKRQFGGIKRSSTNHYLISLTHFLYQGAERSKNVGTILLTDFTKAFDTINHHQAILKLLNMETRPSIVPWIVDFLTDRRQRVRYGQSLSDCETLTTGVPQGTKLGPIIFLCMINDACQSLNDRWKYVDDLSLGENRHNSEESHLQDQANSLAEWSESAQLKLNPGKCMVFTVCFMRNPSPPVPISLCGNPLRTVEIAKVLGVWLQSNLKWDTQVSETTKKGNKRLFMLRRLKSFGVPVEDLVTVYCGFIRPILEYCAPVWHHGLTRKQTATLERVQKRACRIILGQKYTDYTTGLQMCKLETLEKRRAVLCTKFAHSMTTSERIADLLPNTRRQEHGRNLRNSNKMTLAPCRTARFQNSPVPSLLSLLNTNK
ncbi:hypothetical protein Bbelb_201170 [Branchiostoma belcheri]|nr:hypothetical protein Bbelb_201170 [Branchiostoma belcheri]